MSLISSTLTFYYKRVFPIIWIGGCALIGGLGLYAALSKGSGLFPFIVVMPIIFVFGIYFMRNMSSISSTKFWTTATPWS